MNDYNKDIEGLILNTKKKKNMNINQKKIYNYLLNEIFHLKNKLII